VRTRRARIAAFAGLGAAGALALGAGLALWQRCAIAEWLVERELAARGVPAQLRVVRLGWRGAELTGVTLGEAATPDLSLASAELAWSREGLSARRLDRIALRGLRLRARLDDAGLHAGALDALLAGDDDASREPLALPFLEAELRDAEAQIASAQGALLLRAEGSATPDGEVVRATLTLHGESPQGALDFGGGGTVGLASEEVGAVGTLSGVTPWGRADGNVRAIGTLAALRVEFAGAVLPDAEATGVRASEPISLTGAATRENGAISGQASFGAGGLEAVGLGSVARIAGNATFREGAGARSADATLQIAGVQLVDLGGVASAEGTAALRGDAATVLLALRDVVLPDLARTANATVEAELNLASGAIAARIEAARALAPEVAQLSGFVADVRWADENLSGTLGIAKLIELSKPALIAPLAIETALSGTLDRIALKGRAQSPGDGLVFDFDGTLDPAAGSVQLHIVLPETDLAPNTRQPDRVFPWLAGTITRARGRIGGEALASHANDTLAASATIALNGVDLVTPHATLRGLMGVFSITGIDPFETPPGQTIWMQGADAALPLGNGSVRFQLKPEGVLTVERGEWAFAGGKLIFSGDVPLDASERRIALDVEGVSIEKLLAALDFDGLAGTGVLGGTTPIVWHGDSMRVAEGVLRATETGVIRFTSGEGGAALARKQPVLAPVLGALENLLYDELTLTIDGDLGDRVAVKMHIRGRNPNFQKGRPVVLNVNVDLPLGSLLRAASVATGVPEEIEAQVQKAMGEEKP
jgi:hypothetical protein